VKPEVAMLPCWEKFTHQYEGVHDVSADLQAGGTCYFQEQVTCFFLNLKKVRFQKRKVIRSGHQQLQHRFYRKIYKSTKSKDCDILMRAADWSL
jgi:hypothetical protein